MRIVVFGPEQRVGAWENETIVDLNRAFGGYLRERGESGHEQTAAARVPASLQAFIAAGPAALDDARRAIEHASAGGLTAAPDGRVVFRADDVKLHAPWPRQRIACAGGNYADHLRGMEVHRHGDQITQEEVAQNARAEGQWGFWKLIAEVAGPEDEIPYPSRTSYLDYEGEVAIVIGSRGKNIAADRIDDYVWGISLFHDWSIRDGPRIMKSQSYGLAKNFDRSASLGPCIVVGELTPQNVDAETRVNGAVRQHYNTRDMIWPFGEILEWLSRDFTFLPGDVIAGGTAAGTAMDKTPPPPSGGTRSTELFLKVGDVVEVSSPKIGTLRNRIVAG
jgi:acylpyruvate hydrolase